MLSSNLWTFPALGDLPFLYSQRLFTLIRQKSEPKQAEHAKALSQQPSQKQADENYHSGPDHETLEWPAQFSSCSFLHALGFCKQLHDMNFKCYCKQRKFARRHTPNSELPEQWDLWGSRVEQSWTLSGLRFQVFNPRNKFLDYLHIKYK